MAPIRRYLRISKSSVLECRIFLENPADGPTWLLAADNPALPHVIEAVRPLVLPKLREENERARDKRKKKTRVKDVVVKDDFDVSIFLTKIGTRHSLLTIRKAFEDGNSTASKGTAVGDSNTEPVLIREESDSEGERAALDQLPTADDEWTDDKKKLGLRTTYQGFSIWGWVLCLLVTRKNSTKKSADQSAGQVLMEEWISSTQGLEENA